MAKYLTPAILRSRGTGFPFNSFTSLGLSSQAEQFTNIPDGDLAGMIMGAEMQIDSAMGFREDQQGFAYGQRVGEKQPWDQWTRRVTPHCFPTPVISLSKFFIVVGQRTDGSYVGANPPTTLAVINNDEGYVEMTSLSVTIYGITPVFTNLAIIEPFVNMDYLAGYQISETNYRLFAGDAENTSYHSFLPSWDLAAMVPNVYLNGVLQNPSTYAINPFDGMVTFPANARPANSVAVSADFVHQIPALVTQATIECLLDEIFEDYVLRQTGMSGLDSWRSGVRSQKRRQRPEGVMPRWMQTLGSLASIRISSA